jgi:hypothetical protein
MAGDGNEMVDGRFLMVEGKPILLQGLGCSFIGRQPSAIDNQ